MHPFLLPALLLCPVLLAGTPAPVPVGTLLARHLEALGGPAALRAHRSRRTTSVLRGMAPFDIPVTVEQDRQGHYRREVSIQGMVQVTAWDGTVGWKVDPFGGSGTPEVLKDEALADLLEEADFDGDLVEAAAKGHVLRSEGLETLPTGPAHRLALTLKGGRTSTVYLDAGSYLEVKRVQTRIRMGAPQTVEIRSGDHRRVEGVMLPFSVLIAAPGAPEGLSVQVQKVEANPALEAARFARPGR